MESLNKIPAMSPGAYTQFSIVLHQLVENYYKNIEADIIRTEEGIAVLSINSLIINPYKGMTLKYSSEAKKEIVYKKENAPYSKEVAGFIGELSNLLQKSKTYMPLTIENVNRNQSKTYKDSLAVDVYLPRPANIPNKVKSKRTFYTNFYFPRNTTLKYSVKIVNCKEPFHVEINNPENPPFRDPNKEEKEFDYNTYFVKSTIKEDLYKPMCNMDVEFDDYVAGGIFVKGDKPSRISYTIYAKGDFPVFLDTKEPIFTMVLNIDDETVHALTEVDETSINIPL